MNPTLFNQTRQNAPGASAVAGGPVIGVHGIKNAAQPYAARCGGQIFAGAGSHFASKRVAAKL